jgi:glycolate oxidase FAD binding subunit
MAETLTPVDAAQLAEAVAWAAAGGTALEIVGGGSKRGLGRPVSASHMLDLSRLSGVGLYEPDELVLSAGAGTPLSEIEGLLAQNRQQLAFEPADYGRLLGGVPERQTLGGVLACNLSGSRRIKAGAARDHFLGFKAVTGRGEAIKSGGRVVKNVTGYDLSKLLAGSFGTLGVMTEVTVKVLPAPEKLRTVLVYGQGAADGVALLARAAGSPHEVSGLAHLGAGTAVRSVVGYVKDAGASVTAIRIEGPAPSVEHRVKALRDMFAGAAGVEELHGRNSAVFWRELTDVADLLPADAGCVWKLSLTPSEAPAAVGRIRDALGGEAFYDWAGGLVWLTLPAEAAAAGHETVRAAIAGHGHATLIRAPEAVRRAVPVFQPQPPSLAALAARIKHSFDPEGILNPGRMTDGT